MSFVRHQTFYLRAGWLAKAVEELDKNPKLFSEKDATVKLGIGKNMVQSLRFWIRATGLAENAPKNKGLQLTPFGQIVQSYDTFFELDLTWWLIHYHLVKEEQEATSWYFLFNKFSAKDFDKVSFMDAIANYSDNVVSRTSYQKDYDCILATYIASSNEGTPENNTICPLTKLQLLQPTRHNVVRKTCSIKSIPLEVIFLVLKNASKGDYHNVSGIVTDPGNIGKVFNLTLDATYQYLDLLKEKGWLQFSRTAGIDTISLKNLDAWELIEKDYISLTKGGIPYEA